MTQEELAGKATVGLRTIRDIETGRIDRPRQITVRLLAGAFGLHGADRDRFHESAQPEPVLATTPPAPGPEHAARRPTPAQLPADVAGFTGRAGYLRQLASLREHTGGATTAVAIGTITGMAGVGKTTLAVHWAHQVADSYPDGQLYVNMRGFASIDPVDPAEAMRGFLDALGVEPPRIPAGFAAQVGLYRSLLAHRRVLVVLDNAYDSEQVRPLLPGAPGCLVLVTSRDQLAGLVAAVGALPIPLDLMTAPEARELVARRVGPVRAATETSAVDEMISRCGRLPLALAIVAARAATHVDLPLGALADELRASGGDLDAFAGTDPATDARAVFSWSYDALSRPAARLFRLLALHPGPTFSAPAAASLAGISLPSAGELLAELERAHLIIEPSTGRHTYHDLLRAYAAELTNLLDSKEDRRRATHRMLDHYLRTADAAAHLLAPRRNPTTLSAIQTQVNSEDLADEGQALAWLATEHPVLLGLVDHAAAHGFDPHVGQLAGSMVEFLDRRGHWHDLAAVQQAALAAAGRLDDRPGRATALGNLGVAFSRLDRGTEAQANLSSALELFGELGDLLEQACIHRRLGWLFGQRGESVRAIQHDRDALRLFQALGDRVGQARTLNAIGWGLLALGDHQGALVHCQDAFALQRELGDRRGQADTLDSLGYIHHQSGDHPRALACYQEALDLFVAVGERYEEASTLARAGDTYESMGSPDRARTAWRTALAIFEEMGHAEADELRDKLRQP
jgi:tetratricopeptide (TPR) repeat protein/transcriptional regulator with XRE-family HTH domain